MSICAKKTRLLPYSIRCYSHELFIYCVLKSNVAALTIYSPLENQSYSNNPSGAASSSGRSNPILPRNLQDRLEEWGILESLEVAGVDVAEKSSTDQSNNRVSKPAAAATSSQSVDLKKQRVRNVVSFALPSSPITSIFFALSNKKKNTRRGSLTVDVSFKPNLADKRRIDVKFQACRVQISFPKVDVNFPLGVIGPTGWLRTGYIDHTLRITRGHKGSVFILRRPSSASAAI
jgi:hypothetical protein